MTANVVTWKCHIVDVFGRRNTFFKRLTPRGLFRHVSMGRFRRFASYIERLRGYSTNARLSTVRFVLCPVEGTRNYGPNNALRPIFQ